MSNTQVNLLEAVAIHRSLSEKRDAAYINLVQQINTRAASVIKNDMGSQFIQNCGRDIAGEVVRNFFDTSSYNITVDQLAMRILKFSYEDEYDPLAENGGVGEIKKSIYNYNEIQSEELNRIADDLDSCQEQLFTENRKNDTLDQKGKKEYRESQRDENGNLYDDLTGKQGTEKTIKKNDKNVSQSNLHADHIQSREAARYNSKYITHNGVDALREFWNSSDNMQLIHASANTSKGDVRVCEIDGKIQYLNTKDANYDPRTDITHKATPKQLTEAIIQQWTKGEIDSAKIQKLIEEGYLQKDENGKITVPKSVQKALEHNIRHSQNTESVVILKNTQYGEVAKDAATHTKAAIGKIIAGQIIYYTAPPIVYEVRMALQNRKIDLDSALTKLEKAATRITEYVFLKLKDIFSNVLSASLKKFIKSFMDILIGTVKATIKKLLKIAKNLALATVDAVRIIADKNSSSAEKADSVFNLFGITITSCVIEVLFELASEALHIPEPFDDIVFGPLQILTTVICTNLTMLILQKADLFDVRFGYKINAIRNIFKEEYAVYEQEMSIAENVAESEVMMLLERAKEDCMNIYNELEELNPMKDSVQPQLEHIGKMFNVYINYDKEWETFLGMNSVVDTSKEGFEESILKKYRCSVCDWTTGEREGAPKECPICKAQKFVEVDTESTIEDKEKIENGEFGKINEIFDLFFQSGDSYTQKESLYEYKEFVNEGYEKLDENDISFRMKIADCFFNTGRGLVCNGIVELGLITVGSTVTLKKKNGKIFKGAVTAIERYSNFKIHYVDFAEIGDEIGLVIEGIDKKEIERGDIIVIKFIDMY